MKNSQINEDYFKINLMMRRKDTDLLKMNEIGLKTNEMRKIFCSRILRNKYEMLKISHQEVSESNKQNQENEYAFKDKYD